MRGIIAPILCFLTLILILLILVAGSNNHILVDWFFLKVFSQYPPVPQSKTLILESVGRRNSPLRRLETLEFYLSQRPLHSRQDRLRGRKFKCISSWPRKLVHDFSPLLLRPRHLIQHLLQARIWLSLRSSGRLESRQHQPSNISAS
jgi:hypothetical protein